MVEPRIVVCDLGACSIKIGMAGSLVPQAIEPTIVADRRDPSSRIGEPCKRVFGTDALDLLGESRDYNFRRPLDEYGRVLDWNTLLELLRFVLKKIGVTDPTRHKLMIAKPHAMSRNDIDRLLQILFVDLQFQAVTMHEQAALVLYTRGEETGIVVELGDSMANIVPVYKGHAIPNLDKHIGVGGRTVSKHLVKLLTLRGYHVDPQCDVEIGRKLKEQGCYVSIDPKTEAKLAEETTVVEENFVIHDGKTFTIGKERFEAAEALFQPKLVDIESQGLADALFDTIQDADIDCRGDLYSNIILSGGTSLLPGISERVEKDMMARYKNEILEGNETRKNTWKLQVHTENSRDNLVFEGAALFADLIGNEADFWVSRKVFDTFGSKRVLEKCHVF